MMMAVSGRCVDRRRRHQPMGWFAIAIFYSAAIVPMVLAATGASQPAKPGAFANLPVRPTATPTTPILPLADRRSSGRSVIGRVLRCGGESSRSDDIGGAGSGSGSDGERKRDDAPLHPDRRAALASMAAALVGACAAPGPASAGEVGARITAAVTQSDLGVSVRKSVVRGAQIMDKVDGGWERFSDDFGLGAERSRREGRPAPREIPERKALDGSVARAMMEAADESFLTVIPVDRDELQRQIARIDSLVRKSFVRSGLALDGVDVTGLPKDADTFNYLSYVRFRAYSDILLDRSENFNKFRKRFEPEVGGRLLKLLSARKEDDSLLAAKNLGFNAPSMPKRLNQALDVIDSLSSTVCEKGLIAQVERTGPDAERIADWSEDLSDLQFTVALDADACQNAQVLLQEQGYRLYPNYFRYVVGSVLRQTLGGTLKEGGGGQDVAVDEYYMDTAYSSDPDKFEVRQVILNIVLESL